MMTREEYETCLGRLDILMDKGDLRTAEETLALTNLCDAISAYEAVEWPWDRTTPVATDAQLTLTLSYADWEVLLAAAAFGLHNADATSSMETVYYTVSKRVDQAYDDFLESQGVE